MQTFSSHVTQQTTETCTTPSSSRNNDCAFCQRAATSLTGSSQDSKFTPSNVVNTTASNHSYIKRSDEGEGSNELWTQGAFGSLVEVRPIKVEESGKQPTSSIEEQSSSTPVVRKSTRRSATTTSDNRRQEEEVLNLLAPRGVNREHVVNCVLDDFHRVVAVLKTEEHRRVLKEIRKRGKHKFQCFSVREMKASKDFGVY